MVEPVNLSHQRCGCLLFISVFRLFTVYTPRQGRQAGRQAGTLATGSSILLLLLLLVLVLYDRYLGR